MNPEFDICVATPPDREHRVAEISFDHVQWAELNQERGFLEVEFYPRPDGQPWRIAFKAAVDALTEAKRRLVDVPPRDWSL